MKKTLIAMLTSLFMFVCGEASAQVYMGGMYGNSSSSYRGPEEDDVIEPKLKKGTGFRVYVGNEISRKFAAEISYVDLGDYEVGAASGGTLPATQVSDTISIDGLDASFVAKLPLSRRVSMLGRLGLMYWQGERLTIDSTSPDEDPKRFHDTDVSIGVGIEYQFLDRFGMTLEVDQYKTGWYYNLFYGVSLYVTM
ncbi:MAG: porin family protein [Agarilytica sp.]